MKSEFIWDLSASKNQKHVSTSNIFNSLFVSLEIKPNNYRATPFTLFGLKCEQHRYAHFKNRELGWIKANMEIFLRTAVFAWLWLVVGANLLWENNTANWLVAGGWCWFSMREQYCWLTSQANTAASSSFALLRLYLASSWTATVFILACLSSSSFESWTSLKFSNMAQDCVNLVLFIDSPLVFALKSRRLNCFYVILETQ